MAWWNSSYVFRREITVTGVAPANAFVVLNNQIDFSALQASGTVRGDREDVEIVHETNDATPSYTVLSRQIVASVLTFRTNVEIPDTGKFYMYYGNALLSGTPVVRPSYDATQLSVGTDGAGVSYTRPGEHWVDGASYTANSVASFSLYGSSVNIVLEKGPNMGKYTVMRNSDVLGVYDLYSPTVEAFEQAVTFSTLGYNTVSVVVAGDNNPSSSGQLIKVNEFRYDGGTLGVSGTEETVLDTWTSYVGGA
jgi:hypothetical protein